MIDLKTTCSVALLATTILGGALPCAYAMEEVTSEFEGGVVIAVAPQSADEPETHENSALGAPTVAQDLEEEVNSDHSQSEEKILGEDEIRKMEEEAARIKAKLKLEKEKRALQAKIAQQEKDKEDEQLRQEIELLRAQALALQLEQAATKDRAAAQSAEAQRLIQEAQQQAEIAAVQAAVAQAALVQQQQEAEAARTAAAQAPQYTMQESLTTVVGSNLATAITGDRSDARIERNIRNIFGKKHRHKK